MSDQAMQRALAVKRRYKQELLRKANVVTVGIGYCSRGGVQSRRVCIAVSVKSKVPPSKLKPQDVIPAEIENVPVDVVETGEIRALATTRPVNCGFAISLGCGCSQLALLRRLLGIVKPMINEPGNNTVDCAIARPLSADLVDPDILNIGIPTGVGTVTLGIPVQKSGRTTDQITQLDVTVSVVYGTQIAVFRNQLVADAMSQGGDSGSVVLDMDRQVVGLLFAGSTSTTIMNPIQLVLDILQVQVVTA